MIVSNIQTMMKVVSMMYVLILQASITEAQPPSIYKSANATKLENLAAMELQRYLYLRIGALPAIKIATATMPSNSIRIGRLATVKSGAPKIDSIASLGPHGYALQSLPANRLLITGHTDTAVLYGVYHFLETTGIRFDLTTDIIPDKKLAAVNLAGFNQKHKPAFALRGILPFHDFPEGPDWWNEEDYKTVIAQLPKLRINFIGYHTYPEKKLDDFKFELAYKAEPIVWIGTQGDFSKNGTVKAAYPVLHYNTTDTVWGYFAKKTSAYSYGASQLFEADRFGAGYMKVQKKIWPHTANENVQIFNAVGSMLNSTFTLAKKFGVRTCIGTEAPLTIPDELAARLKKSHVGLSKDSIALELYKGTFARIKAAHPLDYYWLWTPEHWTHKEAQSNLEADDTKGDLLLAVKAAEQIKAPFTLATCGWVLGPARNRMEFDQSLPKHMPFSVINREAGFAVVEPAFKTIPDRPKWQISWLEDDGAMITPQFWAGRIKRDAADAFKYGCEGLMGIHWRTTTISPMVQALKKAGWEANEYDTSSRERDLPADDVYREWATSEFGEEAAAEAAAIFQELDGDSLWKPTSRWRHGNFPRTSYWNNGPGAIRVDTSDWAARERVYDFIKRYEVLAPMITGDGAKERYNYWLQTFYFAKAQGHIGSLMGAAQKAQEALAESSSGAKRITAATNLLRLRGEMIIAWGEMVTHQLQAVSSTGEMGTITNLEQHHLEEEKVLTQYDSVINAVLPGSVGPLALPTAYTGKARIIAPMQQSLLERGEGLNFYLRVLSAHAVTGATVYVKPLDGKSFAKFPVKHVGRNVYKVMLSPAQYGNRHFEYYAEVKTGNGVLRFPQGPNKTVVIW